MPRAHLRNSSNTGADTAEPTAGSGTHRVTEPLYTRSGPGNDHGVIGGMPTGVRVSSRLLRRRLGADPAGQWPAGVVARGLPHRRGTSPTSSPAESSSPSAGTQDSDSAGSDGPASDSRDPDSPDSDSQGPNSSGPDTSGPESSETPSADSGTTGCDSDGSAASGSESLRVRRSRLLNRGRKLRPRTDRLIDRRQSHSRGRVPQRAQRCGDEPRSRHCAEPGNRGRGHRSQRRLGELRQRRHHSVGACGPPARHGGGRPGKPRPSRAGRRPRAFCSGGFVHRRFRVRLGCRQHHPVGQYAHRRGARSLGAAHRGPAHRAGCARSQRRLVPGAHR